MSSQKQGTNSPTALAGLAGIAGLSCLLYWLAYSRAYNVLELYDDPLYDIYRRSQVQPDARWWLLGAFLALFALYIVGWRLARRAQGPVAWAIVLGGTLAAGTILLFMFPIGAADVFDYIVHGRILTVYGGNPFIDVGSQFPDDPFYGYMAWHSLPSTYGPLWTLLGVWAARFAGDGIVANLVAFKLLSGAFFFAGIGVVAATLRRVAPEHTLSGVVVLAWNPLVLYETFGNGHNDIAMIFWVLLAGWFLIDRQYASAIVALMAGALFKFVPLLLLPAAGLIALRELPNLRARLGFVLAASLATIVLIVLAYLPFWQGPETLTILRRQDLFTTSLPAVVRSWLEPQFGAEQATALVSRSAASLTVLFALWQGFRAWRDRSWRSFPRAAFWVVMFYLMFTCLWFQEWYTVWPVAVAAMLLSDEAVLLASLLNIAGLTKPTIFVPLWLWLRPLPPEAWRELRLGPAVLALPWLALLIYLFTQRRLRKREPVASP